MKVPASRAASSSCFHHFRETCKRQPIQSIQSSPVQSTNPPRHSVQSRPSYQAIESSSSSSSSPFIHPSRPSHQIHPIHPSKRPLLSFSPSLCLLLFLSISFSTTFSFPVTINSAQSISTHPSPSIHRRAGSGRRYAPSLSLVPVSSSCPYIHLSSPFHSLSHLPFPPLSVISARRVSLDSKAKSGWGDT